MEVLIAFTLDELIGISGSSQVEKFDFYTSHIIPKYNLWCPQNSEDQNLIVPIGDGAYCDVPGIITLLARGAKHIISFLHYPTTYLFSFNLSGSYGGIQTHNSLTI